MKPDEPKNTTATEPSKRVKRLTTIKQPAITTHGLMYRFQVFYYELHAVATGEQQNGPLQWTFVDAETQGQAIHTLTGPSEDPNYTGPRIKFHSIGTGRPILEPERQIFDKMRASAFLGVEPSTINDYMARDLLPRDRSGLALFTLHRLMEVARAIGEEKEAA